MSRGNDALGRVSILMDYNGKEYPSKATDTDIIKSSALAFTNGINAIVLDDELL